MTATVAGIHLGIDTHANRPAANTAPDGSFYSCSDHQLIYKSNFAGNSWATWATLGGTGIAATIFSAKGEVLGASANDTPVVIPAAAGNNDLLGANSSLTAGAGFLRHRIVRKTADQTFSSTSYADSTNMALPLEASKVYKFRFVAFYDTNATTVAIKLAIQGPASCTARVGVTASIGAANGAGNAQYGLSVNSADISTDLEFLVPTAGPGAGGSLYMMAVVEGIAVNSTNAGDLKLRHASETNTNTTIYTNSHGELWEVV